MPFSASLDPGIIERAPKRDAGTARVLEPTNRFGDSLGDWRPCE